MLLRGRTMFAPTMRVVDGIDTYAERVCRRRRDMGVSFQREGKALFDDFWYTPSATPFRGGFATLNPPFRH